MIFQFWAMLGGNAASGTGTSLEIENFNSLWRIFSISEQKKYLMLASKLLSDIQEGFPNVSISSFY